MYVRPRPRYVSATRGLGSRDAPPPRLDGIGVLLVGDLLEALADHLRRVGATATCASSVGGARAALAVARFDLLVSDVGLPDGSGHDVAVVARDLGRVRAAMALTERRGDDVVDASRAAGFQVHVTKPCDPATFVCIAQILLRLEG